MGITFERKKELLLSIDEEKFVKKEYLQFLHK